MGIRRESIGRKVVTNVTAALLANVIPAIWRFVAASRSTHELPQVLPMNGSSEIVTQIFVQRPCDDFG